MVARSDERAARRPLAAHAAAALGRVWPATRITAFTALDGDALAMVRGVLRPGDAVFVKASRSLGLERLIESLREGDVAAPLVH